MQIQDVQVIHKNLYTSCGIEYLGKISMKCEMLHPSQTLLGSFSLTWINFNSNMNKSLQMWDETATPLKSWNESVILSHILLWLGTENSAIPCPAWEFRGYFFNQQNERIHHDSLCWVG